MQVNTKILLIAGIVLIIFFLVNNNNSRTPAAPVVSLPGASTDKDADYYARKIAGIDWKGIGDAINTIWPTKP